MLYKISLAVFLLALWLRPAQGQTRLRFGPELGVTVSQLPARTVLHDGGPYSSYRDVLREPLVAGPLIGGRAQLEMGKRWLFAAALRYQTLGEGSNRESEFVIERGRTWGSQVRQRQIFQQVGVPLSAGYQLFRIAKIPVTFSAGAQMNWLVRAQYQIENISIRQGEIVFSDKQEPINLLEKTTSIRVPVRPFQVQLHASLSAPLGDKLMLLLHYNQGRMLHAYDDFSGIHIDPWICISPFGTSFRHSEFSIVAAYFW